MRGLICALLVFLTSAAQARPDDAIARVDTTLKHPLEQIDGTHPLLLERTNREAVVSQDSADRTEGGVFDVRVNADLRTGEIENTASVYSSIPKNAKFQAKGRIYEFVTFDRDALISYSYEVNGALNGSNPGDYAQIAATAYMYDVSDLDSVFDESQELEWKVRSRRVDNSKPLIATYRGDGTNTLYGDPAEALTTIDQNFDGTQLEVSGSVSGNVLVKEGRLYLLAIGSSLLLEHSGNFDYLSSSEPARGRFRFVELDGASFTSQSGLFLSGVNP